MVKTTTLANGVKVVTVEMLEMQSVTLGLWFCTGVQNEEPRTNGISHLLEHLLFKGTEHRSADALKQAIEGRGGSFNGFTAEEFTCYLVKVLAKDAGLGMDILSDMALHPLLKEEDIEKEKHVVIEEIGLYKDMPPHYVHELLTEILWPGHPLGFPLAGSIESVRSLTRQDVVDYKTGQYHALNAIVAAVGKIEHAATVELAKTHLGSLASGRNATLPSPVFDQRVPRVLIHAKETEQTHLAIGIHALPRFHPDRYPLSLLNIILGGNMSSRLFNKIREEMALCYEIGTSVRRYKDAGAFVLSAGVDPKKLPKALEAIMKELGDVMVHPVTKDELERAKEYYKGQLLLTLEDTMSSMLWYGERVATNENDHDIPKILARVDSVKAEDLQKVAAMILRDTHLNLAVIGPNKNRKEIEEIVHFK